MRLRARTNRWQRESALTSNKASAAGIAPTSDKDSLARRKGAYDRKRLGGEEGKRLRVTKASLLGVRRRSTKDRR
jgi:hypothetical protein